MNMNSALIPLSPIKHNRPWHPWRSLSSSQTLSPHHSLLIMQAQGRPPTQRHMLSFHSSPPPDSTATPCLLLSPASPPRLLLRTPQGPLSLANPTGSWTTVKKTTTAKNWMIAASAKPWRCSTGESTTSATTSSRRYGTEPKSRGGLSFTGFCNAPSGFITSSTRTTEGR